MTVYPVIQNVKLAWDSRHITVLHDIVILLKWRNHLRDEYALKECTIVPENMVKSSVLIVTPNDSNVMVLQMEIVHNES